MNIENYSPKYVGTRFSLHKGSSCEMTTLVDLVVGNAEWPSEAWIAGVE
jgi:hypothetical protein